MDSKFYEHRLPNGLRIVCEVMPRVRSAAVGFLVRTGSRHERDGEHGVSHFLEHMCFKGTPRRDWHAINVQFDDLGSIYNAFTGKEHTVYYGWVSADRLAPQLELLSDMMRPALPPDEFETERKVILEEIAMNGDSFDHHVWNFLHETVFAGQSLAHEILGEQETIAGLPRERMVNYHAGRYAADNLTLLATGAVDPDAVFRDAEKMCGHWNGQLDRRPETSAPVFTPGVRKLKLDQFKQQSLLLVYPSVPHADPRGESIEAYCSLMGGHNSRCYWNIVQKAICTQAGAAWLSYADCGMLVLFADGEPERCEEMLAALREEARRASAEGFSVPEVQRVKNARRTQLALEAENPRTRFMQLVDDLESFNAPRSSQERLDAVEAVTRATINEYLQAFPVDTEGLLLSCGPRDWP